MDVEIRQPVAKIQENFLKHHVNNEAINTLTELNFGTKKNQSWTFAGFFY